MCGIIGLLMKNKSDQPSLGRLMTPMFDCMAERGPDSAGLAIFEPPVGAGLRRFNLFIPDRKYDWQSLLKNFQTQTGVKGQITALENHAVLVSAIEPAAMKNWLAECIRTWRRGRPLARRGSRPATRAATTCTSWC